LAGTENSGLSQSMAHPRIQLPRRCSLISEPSQRQNPSRNSHAMKAIFLGLFRRTATCGMRGSLRSGRTRTRRRCTGRRRLEGQVNLTAKRSELERDLSARGGGQAYSALRLRFAPLQQFETPARSTRTVAPYGESSPQAIRCRWPVSVIAAPASEPLRCRPRPCRLSCGYRTSRAAYECHRPSP
jgi:hypothetical protein